MHTLLCRHAAGEPTEYAARAVALGLKEIGFTVHWPMRRDDFDNWRMRADSSSTMWRRCARRNTNIPRSPSGLALK